MQETRTGGEAREFPQTRWTTILSARTSPEARRRALEELLHGYWKPLYFYVRRKGLDVETAKDAVQGFLLHAIEKDFLATPDPARGRFRTFLRASIDHWLVNEHERETAKKRGGGAPRVSLDFDVAEREVDAAASPDSAFEREWALEVMERAVARLRGEFDKGLRQGPFGQALRFLGTGEAPSYQQAAKESGMSVVRFKAFLHRARVRLRELVREEAAETVSTEEEVDAEMADLMRALRT